MAVKKSSAPPQQEKIHLCHICGKEVHGEHVYIETKRKSKLHIHFGCMPGNNEEKWRRLNKHEE